MTPIVTFIAILITTTTKHTRARTHAATTPRALRATRLLFLIKEMALLLLIILFEGVITVLSSRSRSNGEQAESRRRAGGLIGA